MSALLEKMIIAQSKKIEVLERKIDLLLARSEPVLTKKRGRKPINLNADLTPEEKEIYNTGFKFIVKKGEIFLLICKRFANGRSKVFNKKFNNLQDAINARNDFYNIS